MLGCFTASLWRVVMCRIVVVKSFGMIVLYLYIREINFITQELSSKHT